MNRGEGLDLTADPRGTLLPVRARAGSRRAGLLGSHAGALRVGVAEAPERGKANAAVAALLAEALGCRAASIVLISGSSSRAKRFLIVGLDPAPVRDRLIARLPAG